MIHIILEVIGALVVLVVAYSLALPVFQGLRLSLSFHATAFKGMRKSGRPIKRWWSIPWSLIAHAYEFAGCGEQRKVNITGEGSSWPSDGGRETWDARRRTTDHGGAG